MGAQARRVIPDAVVTTGRIVKIDAAVKIDVVVAPCGSCHAPPDATALRSQMRRCSYPGRPRVGCAVERRRAERPRCEGFCGAARHPARRCGGHPTFEQYKRQVAPTCVGGSVCSGIGDAHLHQWRSTSASGRAWSRCRPHSEARLRPVGLSGTQTYSSVRFCSKLVSGKRSEDRTQLTILSSLPAWGVSGLRTRFPR